DTHWKDHLAQMDALRQGIGLRGYGGKNPKQEYKREAFMLFESLLNNIQAEVIKFLSLVRIRKEQEVDAIERQRAEEAARIVQQQLHSSAQPIDTPQAEALKRVLAQVQAKALAQAQAKQQEQAAQGAQGEVGRPQASTPAASTKVGRNDPCPCGSGQKYKQCHGKLD